MFVVRLYIMRVYVSIRVTPKILIEFSSQSIARPIVSRRRRHCYVDQIHGWFFEKAEYNIIYFYFCLRVSKCL